MNDLFEYEQNIYNNAVMYAEGLNDAKYSELVKEYGRLLKQLRRATKISDRATQALNTSKLDLLDKVHYDSLTGVYNRRFLEETIQREIGSLSRTGDALSVIMLDIDCFKQYNDTYGHNKGDECLNAVARCISKSLLRPDDFVARYGGEEFAVVLPGADENGVRIMAKRILENIAAMNIPHKASDVADHITVSIGATTCIATRKHTCLDYFQRSDEALYQSKQDGRNRYTYLDFRRENSVI